MSREEDLIRSTTRAIASTVREVPPLRLEPAAGELRPPARALRRLHGGSGHRSRWWSWGAPLTAAAVVVALAIALVLVRDIPNGSAVPPNPATSTGPGGAPRYYVALTQFSGSMQFAAGVQKDTVQDGIVVGDSLTGKRIAKFAPPADTTFQSVTAAADDRTFVVFAVSSSSGSFAPFAKGATLTGSWFEVKLAPGTAHPASLTPLPIKPWSWAPEHSVHDYSIPSPGEVFATALSQDGQELAVADIPPVPAGDLDTAQNWQEVKVFSVATGRLLHDWTEHDPAAAFGSTDWTVPSLTWIDGDRALTLATAHEALPSATVTGTVRRLDVAGSASGNLMTDSTVIWSGTLPWNQSGGCLNVDNWPPLISADDNTVSCVTWVMPYASPGHVDFDTYPLVAGRRPTLDYRGTILPEKQTGGLDAGVLWVSPSADTLIVDWGGPGLKPSTGAHFGVISHGKFTPLPLQANRPALLAMDITF